MNYCSIAILGMGQLPEDDQVQPKHAAQFNFKFNITLL
jgi:hypothetical protein